INPSFTYADVKMQYGQVVGDVGWVASDYIGIDQGPIVAMIENYRSGLIWKTMQRNPYLQRGLQRAGFTGGWLEQHTQLVAAGATRSYRAAVDRRRGRRRRSGGYRRRAGEPRTRRGPGAWRGRARGSAQPVASCPSRDDSRTAALVLLSAALAGSRRAE